MTSTLRVKAAAAAATMVLALIPQAGPAQAATYSRCWSQRGGIAPALCVKWTGGSPNGTVWAETGNYYRQVDLLVCSGCGGPTGWKWTVAATVSTSVGKTVNKTRAVKVGKNSWYKVRAYYMYAKFPAEMPNEEAVYLGD